MATTRLIPLHSGKGRTVAEALGRVMDYVENPEKTNGGELVTAYQCNPSIADQEFLFSKRQYAVITGRERKENDVIAYHLRQSFKPGEITPELANKIGYDLAMSLTKGKHAFIVCTHVDKHHIHSHIVFNSIAIDCTRKFRNFWRSSFAIRKISDMLCLENGLSVIAEPKPSRGSYGAWLGEDRPPTVRGQLEHMIDTALGYGCKDFDSFLAAMKAAGVEVKRGKHLAFKIPNGKRFVRCDSLSDDYTEAAIMERISGKRTVAPKAKAVAQSKPNMLIDIQAKMQKINTPGFERWAKIFNLKEMAKTVMYLQENGLTDFEGLEKVCDAAVQKFNDLADQTKAADARMKDISELQRHIGMYSKTREVYAQYRKLTGRKQAEFYEQHTSEITTCQAAKRYFNSLGLKKLPYRFSLSDAEKLHTSARNAVATFPKNDSTKLLITQAADSLNAVYDALFVLRDEMLRLASLLPEFEIVMAMYGAGEITGPQLMAEIGDVRRFTHKGALVAFAGMDAPPYQSGTFDSKSRRISKRDSPQLRRTLFQIASVILQHSKPDDPIFWFMDKKRAEGKHFYVYTVAGAAKFLRIYYARVKAYLKALDAAEKYVA